MARLLLLLMLSLQAPQKNSSPTNRAQTSAANQRGSDSLPIAVKLMNTGESEGDAKREAQRIEDERVNAERTYGLTKALVWGTVLTLFVLIVQSWYLRRSVLHAEKATRIDLRAYISVGETEIRPDGGSVTLTNNGRTPARDIRARIHGYIGPKSKWPSSYARLTEPMKGETSLAAGASKTQPFPLEPLTSDEIRQIEEGDPAWIYVHGFVTYKDVFGKDCVTEYCFDLPADGSSGRYANNTEGYNKET
jgi:hypothetical protein